MYQGFRYWGFLSYSHDDRRVAERLHQALENYRIPPRLVGLDGPFGPVPARLLPIFRDRDELKAGGHLGADVEHALSVSRSLIVLCSITSATSRWVDAEITAFIALHPDGPLLCVLLSGEPLAGAKTRVDANQCLPPTVKTRFSSEPGVKETAPIAVDLRPGGDGWRLAIHKIVAGLTGLPLDQLVQRDAQRRHRRMAWLSIALVAVAIALGVLAVLAYRARDEARDQRAQAEGLIEFMLVDLRKQLEPAGRLDVLAAVGTRALGYYNQQSLRALDPDSLARRARALHLIGEIDDRRGDIKAARIAFTNARATTGELLARSPQQPERLYDHAQSVYWNGYIDWQYGDTISAERAFTQYGHLAGTLSAQDPSNPDWLAEVGYAHSNLGALLLEQGRAAEAIPQFQQSLRINRKRARLPGDAVLVQLDIGQDRSWLSSALYANRQLGPAVAEREAELGLYAMLLKTSPGNAVVEERQMYAYRFLGAMHLAADQLAMAKSAIERSIVLAEEQQSRDAENMSWRQSVTESHVLAARLARRSGALHVAGQDLDVAGRQLGAQLAHDPETWVWRVELQESIAAERAALLLQENQLPQAERVLYAAQQRLQEAALEPSSATRVLRLRISNAAMQARLAHKRGDRDAQHMHWQQVAALAGDHVGRLDGTSSICLVEAWADMGRLAEARSLARQLMAAGYRDPVLVFQPGAVEASSFSFDKQEKQDVDH